MRSPAGGTLPHPGDSWAKNPVLTCDECSRPAMTFDPARELVRIESRHGGARHVTVLTFQQLVARVSALAVKA